MDNSRSAREPKVADLWNLPKPAGRFNDWGERKWIQVSKEKSQSVDEEIQALNLSHRARLLYQTARLTESSGIEFVMLSDAQLPVPVAFEGSGIHIVPCFRPLRLEGGAVSEERQAAMAKRGGFIYDGWLPVKSWTEAKLEGIVSDLDDTVNLFSLVGKYHAYWEPKYDFTKQPVSWHLIFPDEFHALGSSITVLNSLATEDKVAVSRSVAWITNALKAGSDIQRFLLLFVSIEALVSYIERESAKNSPLRKFAKDRLPKSERKEQREICIQRKLNSDLELTQAVQEAYFECIVGSRAMLENHLNRVFGNELASKVMFREKVAGNTLWGLRNDIAHGSLNLLSEEEIRFVSRRVGELEGIARQYLRTILGGVADVNFPPARPPLFTVPASQAIGSPETEYKGPIDMAEYYLNVEGIASSYVQFFGQSNSGSLTFSL